MKLFIGVMICLQAGVSPLLAQGAFAAGNSGARTHIGSIDGPLAGEEILAQMLAGKQSDSLVPVADPIPHIAVHGTPTGALLPTEIVVPFCPIHSYAYVQLWAWDSRFWGMDYSAVPADQFGKTDIVAVFLVEPEIGPLHAPGFSQPALVPIPEPSVAVLLVTGAAVLVLFRAMGGWRRMRQS